MIKIGIIGPGSVAEKHATALKQVPEAQLWSICSNNLKKLKNLL